MLDIIVIGDSCQDIFLQMAEDDLHVFCEVNKHTCEIRLNYADKIPVHKKFESVGGNAANAAVSAARLGLKTALYTNVGADRAGKHILKEIESAGVESDYFVQTVGEETNYNTVLMVAGERTILVYHNDRHYSLPHLQPAKWVYFTSMKSGFEVVLPALIAYSEKYKVKLCYQPGTFQLKQRGGEIEKLLKHTEAFFVNREEAARYLGLADATPLLTLLKGLATCGVKNVVITDGAQGAYAYDGRQAYFLRTLPDTKRVESTGAGDAFSSATTVALCLGIPLPEAIRWGLMQASSVIQFVGAQAGLLTKEALLKELALHDSVKATPFVQED